MDEEYSVYYFISKNSIIIDNFYRYNNNNNLIILPKDKKNPIILKERLNLLRFISKIVGKNITSVKTIFISRGSNFGNEFLLLNKVIFYCEILRCKKIILNREYYWYIKAKIINKKDKMIIEKGIESDFKSKEIIIDKTFNFYYYSNYIKPELKINLLKKEIFKNLPKIKIESKDLIIYIRSDDIFDGHAHLDYSQPPLCFYKTIIKNYKFKNIFIIAKNKKNPNINYLLKQFPNIIFNNNRLDIDISYLVHAYNIVGCPSTFFFSIFQLNQNIKNLWEFDFQHNNEKRINFLAKFLNSFNSPQKSITIYRMNSSIKYKKEMLDWKCTKNQINLMLNVDCPFNFSIIKTF